MSDVTSHSHTVTGSRRLDADRIGAVIAQLVARIRERFPNASLADVAIDLQAIAGEHAERVKRISRPHLLLRAGVGAVAAVAAALMFHVARRIDFSKTDADNVYSVLQGIEATFNIVILVSAALLFLVTAERRLAQRRALHALSELRSIIHVIDMHQLSKDPAQLFEGGAPTAHSPKRTMSPFELSRYLDYCSELLALTGKVAALYAQHVPDPVVVEAVSDLERLTSALSQKIWQKLAIISGGQQRHSQDGAASLAPAGGGAAGPGIAR